MIKYSDYQKDKSMEDLLPEEFQKIDWTQFKIVVPTEKDREELQAAFKHFHDSEIDTEFVTVNQLVHLYQATDLIIVDKAKFDKL